MSYYFGVLLKSHAILVSDRQKTKVYPDGNVETFLDTKIWKIRDDLYATAAGNLSMAEDCVVKALPQVLKDLPLDLEKFEKTLPEWADYFMRNWDVLQQNIASFPVVAGQNEESEREDNTTISVAGVDTNNVPFIVEFNSLNNFNGKVNKLIAHRVGAVLVPPCPPGMSEDQVELFFETLKAAMDRRLQKLLQMKTEQEQIKRALKIMPEIIEIVAKEDRTVSKEYDLVVVGRDNTQLYSGKPSN